MRDPTGLDGGLCTKAWLSFGAGLLVIGASVGVMVLGTGTAAPTFGANMAAGALSALTFVVGGMMTRMAFSNVVSYC